MPFRSIVNISALVALIFAGLFFATIRVETLDYTGKAHRDDPQMFKIVEPEPGVLYARYFISTSFTEFRQPRFYSGYIPEEGDVVRAVEKFYMWRWEPKDTQNWLVVTTKVTLVRLAGDYDEAHFPTLSPKEIQEQKNIDKLHTGRDIVEPLNLNRMPAFDYMDRPIK